MDRRGRFPGRINKYRGHGNRSNAAGSVHEDAADQSEEEHGRRQYESDSGNLGTYRNRHGPGRRMAYSDFEVSDSSVDGGDRRRSGTGRFPGANRGRGRNVRGNTDRFDLTKAFESLKFVAKSKVDEKKPEQTRFEDVEVYLTKEELSMPPGFIELRKVLKRCAQLKRFDTVPRHVVQRVLEETRNELPALKPGLKAEIIVIPNIQNPPVFFAQLKLQKDRLNFINFVLTDMVEHGKLPFVSPVGCQRGLGVAVPAKIAKGMYVRAEVRSLVSVNNVQVYLADYGVTETVELARTAELPTLFSDEEPSVGFHATFTDIMHMSESAVVLMFKIWQRELEESNSYSCEITEKLWLDDSEVFGVTLVKQVEDKSEDVAESLIAEAVKRGATLSDDMQRSAVKDSELQEESAVLLHSNSEVDIQPYRDDDYRFVKQVAALSVKSPGDMIFIYAHGDWCGPSWFKEMQDFYQNKEISCIYDIRTERVMPNRCYVWQDTKKCTWNRVKVIRLTDAFEENGALVWALDRGEIIEVDSRKMMEINPRFCCSSALSFRAHVAHIRPNDSSGEWSLDATERLSSLLGVKSQGAESSGATRRIADFGKLLDAVIVETVDVRSSGTVLDSVYTKSLGIVMTIKNSPNSGTVQTQLVRKKLALPCGPCAGSSDLAYTLTGTPYYDRAAVETFLKSNVSRRTYKISLCDAKQIVNSFKAEGAHLKIRASVSSRMDWKNLRDGQKRGGGIPDGAMALGRHIPEVMQMHIGYLNISCEGTGPGHFYIQMQSKWRELDRMMEDLQEFAKRLPYLDPNDIRAGMLVLAKSLEEDEFNSWGRAVVVSVNTIVNMYRVLFVDFGYEFEASLSCVRQLPTYFDTIPPFCHRVHLELATPDLLYMPAGSSWSPAADQMWKKMINEWSTVSPIYYGWTSGTSEKDSVVYLENFEQKLTFDCASRRWSPEKRTASSTRSHYSTVNAMRDHPLLRQFFASIGLNISYEKEESGNRLNFVPIWNNLLKAGMIVPLAPIP